LTALIINPFLFRANAYVDSAIRIKRFDKATKFILYVVSDNIENFKQHIKAASVLKKYGTVQINVGTLADKSFHEIPEDGNPWAEYASNNATLTKFFPESKVAAFLPADFIKKNRDLLLAKTRLLKENGMQGAVFANEPGYLSAAFFDAYPRFRGPRVDHPRRSTMACFSPCLSEPGMQEIYSSMMAAMLTAAPEIKSYFFKTNDAGSGNCWTDWLYPGPNGPDHCKNESTGQRMKNLFDALQAGAAKAGTSLDVYLSHGSSNFTDAEKTDIAKHLPQNCYFENRSDFEALNIGSDISSMYPVTGVTDVYSFLQKISVINRERPQTIFINFASFYNRGNEDVQLEALLLQMLADRLAEKYNGSPKEQLQQYCEQWAPAHTASKLAQAFEDLHRAFEYRNKNLRNLNLINWSVAARLANRPLVAAPQRLSGSEESYFLPYVFNVSVQEARDDYIDIQGGRWETNPDSIKTLVTMLNTIAGTMADISLISGSGELIQKMQRSLKVYSCLLRSIGNFASAQKIRDAHADRLSGTPGRPSKEPTWSGDKDLLQFNDIMRDELDNTTELLSVLQKGGLHSLILAKDIKHEDCFLLGPDIIGQLKKKQKVMLAHWTDIEDYLTSPFK